MFDLADFDLEADAERGATLTLADPRTGKPLMADDGAPVTITLKGAEGTTYERARRRVLKFLDDTRGPGYALTEEEQDATVAEILAAVTTEWAGIAVEGSAWDCNAGTALALYKRFGWIRRQVDAFVSAPASFAPLPKAA